MIEVKADKDGVMEVIVEGSIDRDQIETAFKKLEGIDTTSRKLRVMEVIRSFHGLTPDALWQDLTHAPLMLGKTSHVAVVTDEAWVRTVTTAAGFVLPLHLKVFTLAEQDAARTWLETA